MSVQQSRATREHTRQSEVQVIPVLKDEINKWESLVGEIVNLGSIHLKNETRKETSFTEHESQKKPHFIHKDKN